VPEWVTTIMGIGTLAAAVAGLVALAYERLVHRAHLRQAEQDHHRVHRLSNRLAGCAVDLERLLEGGLPVPGPGLLPDSVTGHMAYLFAIRDECEAIQSRTASHNARISWTRDFREKVAVTSRRCAAAHAAVAGSAGALSQAARVYEEGFVAAHSKRAGAGGGRAPGEPMLLLSQKRAETLRVQRAVFDGQMQLVATHTRARHPLLEYYRCNWPVFRSESQSVDGDPYRGEVRPMGHHGFGPVPVLHPEAR
jgi:uncharacterized membrane protein